MNSLLPAKHRTIGRSSIVNSSIIPAAKSNPHLLINAAVDASGGLVPRNDTYFPTKLGWRAVWSAYWESGVTRFRPLAGRLLRNAWTMCNTMALPLSWDWIRVAWDPSVAPCCLLCQAVASNWGNHRVNELHRYQTG